MMAAEGSEGNNFVDKTESYPRLLVMFRPPSRHTYGFREGDTYDLPLLELQTLIQDRQNKDIRINFIPVIERSKSSDNELQPQQQKQSRKQMKKKKQKKNPYEASTQSLYWLKCSDNAADDIISTAVSRAILTHASFRIQYSSSFTNDDWINPVTNCEVELHECLDGIDVISMSNPNMSNEECSNLLQTVSILLQNQKNNDLNYLQREFTLDESGILIYHCEQRSDNTTHCIHVGSRMAIGPAGTFSAPSQTLRRTHRGILREYALKNRFKGVTAESDISTAMEPELGFLMANLALVGTDAGQRVMDPCCGSGSLLLYAAAFGARDLIGVDSLANVWESAEDEFKRHTSMIGKRKFSLPTFFQGDVLDPTSTDCLYEANSCDAIVVDPPYNIGAPVLLAGQDVRPNNHHHDEDDGKKGISNLAETINNVEYDTIPSILTIALRVLVDSGRLVFFIPVRGAEEMNMTLKQLLVKKGWQISESDEHLQILFGRLQRFTPTFARWLVCMAKSSANDIH